MFVLKGKLAKIGVLPKYAIEYVQNRKIFTISKHECSHAGKGWGGNVTAARGIVRMSCEHVSAHK